MRKGQEVVITLMIGAIWSKRRILEVYLNAVEWGNGIYGAEVAPPPLSYMRPTLSGVTALSTV